jgi:aminocarboxymuconate-semialdehyde decarboxylase
VILDCHRHIIPPVMLTGAVPQAWRPVLGSTGLGRQDGRPLVSFRGRTLNSVIGEFADPDAMLAQAQLAGVTHLLVSPWVLLIPVQEDRDLAAQICRAQNESLAEVAAASPGDRIRGLGAVPLQDPELATAELEYLMTLPGMYGVEVPAAIAGLPLHDDKLAPFWEAAAGTGAIVFVHPTTTGLGLPGLDGHYLWNSVGNPLETSIAAAQLVAGGVLERCPSLIVLLAHGGGALLSLRGRLRHAHAVRPEARSGGAAEPDEMLARLYFDSLTHDRDVLADLVGFAGAGHVLLGTDGPFDMGTEQPVAEIAALNLPPAAERLILGGNACRLMRTRSSE